MDQMIRSRLGKLRIICSLPLFSDAICVKKQSAAEHGFSQILLSMALTPQLKLPTQVECELLELAIFAELPKSYLGDPSYYLRERHPDVSDIYKEVRGRLWLETEEGMGMKTTRQPEIWTLHELLDAYCAMLYIEKECLIGNSYFLGERYKTNYHKVRQHILKGEHKLKKHPAIYAGENNPKPEHQINWKKAIIFLDELFDESTRARLEGGIGEYSSTFLGMMEKLKEHYRYKGWSYLFKESVGEHTFQVVYCCKIVATALGLSHKARLDLYRLAALHDLAEAYASDVVYPIKMREKDLSAKHVELEEMMIDETCEKLGIELSNDPFLLAIVDICDRVSAKLYFDREIRSGNSHFNVPNTSWDVVTQKYKPKYPEVFVVLENLWNEFIESF